MKLVKLFVSIIFILFFALGCSTDRSNHASPLSHYPNEPGPLIGTRIHSMEELKEVMEIEYEKGLNPMVRVVQNGDGNQIISELAEGLKEDDFRDVRDGSYYQKILFALNNPSTIALRNDIVRIYLLSRRRHRSFGPGDVAFYDFAEIMTHAICLRDRSNISESDFSEKGYLNTFNHVTAQAFVTALFSEELAEFVADVHERQNMPELITGKFSDEQLKDPIMNPMDNYVDMVNNEWGQELGSRLKAKHSISRLTNWSPKLLTEFLNDILKFYEHSLGICLKPFHENDEAVVRFAEKINTVMKGKQNPW